MLIIDRKGFRVMSILHRTYRVTRLRVIYLLNTRQGVWEKITEKVSDTEKFRTAESYRRERSSDKFRWYRKVVSGYTIKSNWFRHMPDNSWRVPESFWKLFGIFWDKNRKCSGAAGATSDAFRRWKSLNPELFRNALKIILVGTGNVLSPHKYFQFDQTLKNVVVNSESAFWDIYGKPPFGALLQKILGMTWMDRSHFLGPSWGCGRPHGVSPLGDPLVPWFHS